MLPWPPLGGDRVKLHQFMTTPELAGAEFSGPSWATWRIIARLIDGDAHLLTPDEQALALQLTGRTRLPTTAPRELYVGAGRRSGKSRFGSLVAVWLAAQEFPQLAAGETAVVVDVAPDRRQATIDLEYSRGIVTGSEILAAELSNPTQDTLPFKHRTLLEVATASRSPAPTMAACTAPTSGGALKGHLRPLSLFFSITFCGSRCKQQSDTRELARGNRAAEVGTG